MKFKKLTLTITTIALMAALMTSTFFLAVSATTFTTNGVTVEGVLATDSYVLYPYETDANLILGISKYGELINGEVDPEQGLEYDGMDVFANPNVLETDWSQGWFIDIHYVNQEDEYQRAWAFAMYTDLSGSLGIGGAWQEACTNGPTGSPSGGRKTNVWATTEPIKVLYDGPRRFVAETKTILYDNAGKTSDDALVSITITFVFNKDKKCVVLYKDIKRLDQGKFSRKFQVEFSNRGEWDIGTVSAPPSYAHFYDNLETVYDYEYHDFYSSSYPITGFDVAQMVNEAGTYVGFAAFWPQLYGKMVEGTTEITRSTILSSLSTLEKSASWTALITDGKVINFGDNSWAAADLYPTGDGESSDVPMVFKNGILQTNAVDYTWDDSADEITFIIEPEATDVITIVYKSMVNAGETDMSSEPDTPYVIGEWVFDLKNEERKKQFRGVTVYGLINRHDADDVQASGETWSSGADVIDSEIQYYLNETFNPYDLNSAVHKNQWRWVDIRELLSTTDDITLTDGLDDQLYYATLSSELSSLGFSSAGWTKYFLKDSATYSAESTWVNTFEDGAGVSHSKNWALLLNSSSDSSGTSDGYEMLKVTPQPTTGTITAPLTLQLKDLVDFDFWYKFVSGTYGPHIEIKVSETAAGGETAQWVNIAAENSNPEVSTTEWTHYTLNNIEDFVGSTDADTAFFVTGQGGGATIDTDPHSFEYFTADDKLGNFYVNSIGIQTQDGAVAYVDDLSVAYLNKTSGIRYERVYNMEEDKLVPSEWDAYCSFAERVLANNVLLERGTDYSINFETGVIDFTPDLATGTDLEIVYSTIEENEKGRYEWLTVGKDAATIDSIGAAYMSEAFDSIKDIEVTKTALDIRDADYGQNAPYVMAGATSSLKADYRDALMRAHLANEWCTSIPVASSNMLFAGGARANLGSEYFNDFTMAFYTMGEYVTNDTGHANKLMALSCWNKNTYMSDATTGYAAISVYKDLNGTIGFLIWGIDGQDTYYATNWFWSIPNGMTAPDDTMVYSGIEYLQHENLGVTDIILEIEYPTSDPIHPTFSIVERIGTISEKTPHDP